MINVLVTRLQHRPLINNHSHFPSLSLSETGFTFFSLILGSKNDNVCARKVPKFVESGKKVQPVATRARRQLSGQQDSKRPLELSNV